MGWDHRGLYIWIEGIVVDGLYVLHVLGISQFMDLYNSITFSQSTILQIIDRDWYLKTALRIYGILTGSAIKAIGRVKQTKSPETHSPPHPSIPKQI